MVVTRRTPVVPAPPTSRTQSTQGVSRSSRPSDANGLPSTSSPLAATASSNEEVCDKPANGLKTHDYDSYESPLKNPKKKDKGKKAGKKKSRKNNFQAFLDFLYKLILISFAVYALSVCPSDETLQSPICYGLSAYKRIILDPYIIPPIQAAFAHPAIAPHVETAMPYVNRAVDIAVPILLRTHREWNLRVVPQWEKRVVPQWKKRVVPEWEKRVVPQWNKHVVPHIKTVQDKVEPYRAQIETVYEKRLAPQARQAAYNLQRWQYQAQPYIVLAVSRTQQGYHAAKPYAIPLAQRTVAALQQFLLFLREQRQKFVDPHVATIWEKVKELSNGKQHSFDATPGKEAPPPAPSSPVSILESVTLDSITAEIPLASPAHQAPSVEPELIFEETEDVVMESIPPTQASEESMPETIVSATTIEESIPSSVPNYESVSDLESESAIVSETTHSILPSETSARPSSIEADVVSFVSETLASITQATAPTISAESAHQTQYTESDNVSITEESTPSIMLATSPVDPLPAVPSASSQSYDHDDIDMDAFYAELGLDETLATPADTTAHAEPPIESDEDREERFPDLNAQMEAGKTQLITALNALRYTASAELQNSVEIRHSIEGLVADAEKYIKGGEVYLKNLKGEGRKQEEKLALWDRVVGKVGEKFEDRLKETESIVNGWYTVIRDQEVHEIAKVSAEVREIAEKGQVDLGLDYAWLDDVTYADWQRYHALIETSEQFTDEATSIQNGTHPSGSTNPLIPIIEDLELEVQDVVIGFETRLRRIKRDGERAFNSPQKEEDKASATDPEPGVSILPVPNTDIREETGSYVPPVVIGRSKEEVLEALGKVELQDNTESHPAESQLEPEEVVESLVHEAEAEAEEEMRFSDTPILHTEL
ncbi:hypothetical protein BJ138DRAFT_1009137 [Hygrophoropsis aurantiaca]|uniref:Uncharacterized protein n=1 Tax=Hygrophoropsis aurantiaca TaxID=72124 RepID=A0ACB8AA21_9AGAM|nr:hypothetical protein BJ138DRAFT_1009137 [Hygrophoropsis aurantiaca]